MQQSSKPRHVEVHGHRGARARLPENSLAAFRYAIAQNVDAIELDVVVTADQQLVVTHDEILNPELCQHLDGTAIKGDFVIYQHSLRELRSFDCGAKKNPKFPLQQPIAHTLIPTLAEVFALLQEPQPPTTRQLVFNIEAKTVPGRRQESPEPQEFARLLVAEIKRHGLEHRVLVQSFDHMVLRYVKDLQPGIKTSALVHQCHPDLVALARSARTDAVSPHHEWITADDVVALHKADVRVIAWTVNAAADWQRMLDIGVDGIISDDPEALIGYLQQQHARLQ